MKSFEFRWRSRRPSHPFTHGFTYLGLIIFLAILSVTALGTISLDAIAKRRQAEEELLRIGKEFRRALILYAVNSPAGTNRLPRSLEDLCRDPRYSNTKRYLRKVYSDPLTGNSEWGLVRSPDGSGIVGVYSLAAGTTLKVAMFDQEFDHFSKATTYREWVFSIN